MKKIKRPKKKKFTAVGAAVNEGITRGIRDYAPGMSNAKQLANHCEEVRELFDDGLDDGAEYSYEVAVLTSLACILRFIGTIKRIAPFALGLLIGELLLSPLIELLAA